RQEKRQSLDSGKVEEKADANGTIRSVGVASLAGHYRLGGAECQTRSRLREVESVGVQDFAHLGGEAGSEERLLEKGRGFVEAMALDQNGIGVAGHEEYFDARAQRADL